MTPQDIILFNDMVFFIFFLGLISGAIFTGILKNILSFVDRRSQLPRRIKTPNGYLYRYFNQYVSLELRDNLIKQRRKAIYSPRPLTAMDKKILIALFAFFIFTVCFGIYVFNTSPFFNNLL